MNYFRTDQPVFKAELAKFESAIGRSWNAGVIDWHQNTDWHQNLERITTASSTAPDGVVRSTILEPAAPEIQAGQFVQLLADEYEAWKRRGSIDSAGQAPLTDRA